MERRAVLARLRRLVGDSSAEGRVREPLVFCQADGEPLAANLSQARFPHGDHVGERAFIFLPEARWEFRPDGELQHFTAAAIPWREHDGERRYCLFRRRTHPIGYYTVPAGHLDRGEAPEAAALREAYEETRLGVVAAEPVGSATAFEEECRRGADHHLWHVWQCRAVGEPQLSDEGDVIGWYARREILEELRLTRPTGALFELLLGERPRHVRAR